MRRALLVCMAPCVLVLVGAAVRTRATPAAPRRATPFAAAVSTKPEVQRDGTEAAHPDADPAPRLDPQALQAILEQAGVTPEKIAVARADARAEALAAIRGEAEPFARRVAVFHLWNTRQVDDEAVDAILDALGRHADDEGFVRQALYAMKDSPRADVSAITQTCLRTSSSAVVRLAAVKSLHFRPGEDVTRSLAMHLRAEQEPLVLRRTLLALGTRALTDPVAKEALETRARLGADGPMRAEAARLLQDNQQVLDTLSRK